MDSKTAEILEPFEPDLDIEHRVLFKELISKVESAYPHYRGQVIQKGLEAYLSTSPTESIESIKYIVSLSVLIDLTQQGWSLEVHNECLMLRLQANEASGKDQVRSRLSSERKAQFLDASVVRFIEKMESEKQYQGHIISIRSL
ncbi:MAG: hypothetical protein IIZ29_01230, partial [Schwartzia sp.]|nr:hypothetical protein [Schwartzia sp. (in: firmicutes)]